MNTAAIIARCTPYVLEQLTGTIKPTAGQLILPILAELGNIAILDELEQPPLTRMNLFVTNAGLASAYVRLCAVVARFPLLEDQTLKWRAFGHEFRNPELSMLDKVYETTRTVIRILEYQGLLHADRVGQAMAMLELISTELGLTLETSVETILSAYEASTLRVIP